MPAYNEFYNEEFTRLLNLLLCWGIGATKAAE